MVGRFVLLMLLFVPALASYAGFVASFTTYLIAGMPPAVAIIQTAIVFCTVVPALLAVTYPLMLRFVCERPRGTARIFISYLASSVVLFGAATIAGLWAIVYGYATSEEVAVIWCVCAVAIMALAGWLILSRAPERVVT